MGSIASPGVYLNGSGVCENYPQYFPREHAPITTTQEWWAYPEDWPETFWHDADANHPKSIGGYGPYVEYALVLYMWDEYKRGCVHVWDVASIPRWRVCRYCLHGMLGKTFMVATRFILDKRARVCVCVCTSLYGRANLLQRR